MHYDSNLKTTGKVDAKIDMGIKSSQEEDFFEILSKYLEKSNNSSEEKINLFILSGDIIPGWDKNAQKAFSEKFITLLNQNGYDKKDILIVPGNHDVKKASPISSNERYNDFYEYWKGCKLPYLDGKYKTTDIVCDPQHQLMFIPLNTANWSQVRISVNQTIQEHINNIDDGKLKEIFEKQFTYDAAYISKEQLNKVEEEIKKINNYQNYTKILIQHHHLVAVDNSIEVKEMGDILNSEDLKNFIKTYNIKVLLHGHKHVERTFYEYLNNNDKPYKLLISSAPNLQKDNFFQILEFENLNIKIKKYDRDGNNNDSKTFNIYDIFETNNTIVLEDDNITSLYNKVINIASNETNKNKQLICNFDLKNYQEKEYPIPLMYPNDKNKQIRYEKEIKKHVDWWQQDRTIFNDIGELHGPRLKKYNGYIDQLNYIYQQLKSDLYTSKTVAILIEPIKDFHDNNKYPSFISCQFIIREKNEKKYLDILANFRKQEMRYWWALNIAELYKLQHDMKNKLGNEIHLGKITTISNIFTYAKENAFGRSYVSSIDYYIDIDPAYVMHQAHSIMCNKTSITSIEELEKTEFVKLLDEIFEDFDEFVNSKDNKDGNAKPRIGIIKLAEFIKKAKNNICKIQNDFHDSLERLGEIAENSDFINKFETSLESFRKELTRTKEYYTILKKDLIKTDDK